VPHCELICGLLDTLLIRKPVLSAAGVEGCAGTAGFWSSPSPPPLQPAKIKEKVTADSKAEKDLDGIGIMTTLQIICNFEKKKFTRLLIPCQRKIITT
jgi:hypothetical protein